MRLPFQVMGSLVTGLSILEKMNAGVGRDPGEVDGAGEEFNAPLELRDGAVHAAEEGPLDAALEDFRKNQLVVVEELEGDRPTEGGREVFLHRPIAFFLFEDVAFGKQGDRDRGTGGRRLGGRAALSPDGARLQAGRRLDAAAAKSRHRTDFPGNHRRLSALMTPSFADCPRRQPARHGHCNQAGR